MDTSLLDPLWMVPLVQLPHPGLEMSAPILLGAEMRDPVGAGPEVGAWRRLDMHGVLHGSERMQEIVRS